MEDDRQQRLPLPCSLHLLLSHAVLEALAVRVEERAVQPDDQDTRELLRLRMLVDVHPPAGDVQKLLLPENIHLRVDNLLDRHHQRDRHCKEDALEGSQEDRAKEGDEPGQEVLPLLDLTIREEYARFLELKEAGGGIADDGVEDAPGHEADRGPQDHQHGQDDERHKDVGPQGRLDPHAVGQRAPAEADLRGHAAAHGARDVGQA
mmetsp:Transcript_14839/g.42547  ORF Transcript_14839/g.42547 Transcript_14839/m.42547 type:complete len:206 (+) Transcript_14839:401-1018(+)